MLWSHPPFPQTIDQRFPRCFPFTVRHLPVHYLAFAEACGPETECDEDDDFLTRARFAFTLAFVQFDGVRLGLHAQPNPIELHYGGDNGDRRVICLSPGDSLGVWCACTPRRTPPNSSTTRT